MMEKKKFDMYKLTGCESSAETIELGDKVYEKLEPQVKSCIENNIKFIIDCVTKC